MIASAQTNNPLVDTQTGKKAPDPIKVACAHLKSAGLRITQPRIAILKALIQRGQPTNIEQIHGDLPQGSCDLVTVYRCMGAFEDISLVHRSFNHNGTSLYTVNLGGAHRYHVICKNTNEPQALDEATVAELRRCVQQVEDVLRTRGYEDVSHVVEFFGVAPTGGRLGHQAASAVPAR
jgi:Fur family ferric uptake transcriptional regulator